MTYYFGFFFQSGGLKPLITWKFLLFPRARKQPFRAVVLGCLTNASKMKHDKSNYRTLSPLNEGFFSY